MLPEITLLEKQELINQSKRELIRLMEKKQAGEELSKDEIVFLMVSLSGALGVIQSEILDPGFEKLKNEGPLH